MEIKFNSSKLDFKASPITIVRHLLDFSFGSAVTELINVEANIEAKAFHLLFNVTRKTNAQLSSALAQEQLNTTVSLTDLFYGIELEWRNYFEQNITITREFFENAIQHNPAYLTTSYRLFEKYLQLLGIVVPDHFYYTYYESFRQNLSEEFQLEKERYRELIAFFDNPVSTENEKLVTQIRHYIRIKELYAAPLQTGFSDATETLRDLYTEPHFSIYIDNSTIKVKNNDAFVTPQTPITIHHFLNEYFLKGIVHPDCKQNYNMIFVLGQPGQGKTSFCHRLVYDILESTDGLPDTPLYFIKIRDLHTKDFINDTFATINSAICQNIDFKQDKCLLVMDGLDEAYMNGGLKDTDLGHLYERLNKTSRANPNLKIILTSRLNYLKLHDPSLQDTLILHLEELTDAQIGSYINRFKAFYPQNQLVDKIHTILHTTAFAHIKELIQQPLLLYFIALSNINIDEKDAIVQIYNKIFNELALRSWDKNGQLNYIKPGLKDNPEKYSQYLRKFVRHIANEIYQSPHLYISAKKLYELEATSQFIQECFHENFIKKPNTISNIGKYLLISFYFQESDNNEEEDTVIEFFHNSLWEYLTAEYIWEAFKQLVLHTDPEGTLKTVALEDYFNLLKRLTGSKKLQEGVVENLEKIIALENGSVKRKIISQTTQLFYKLIEKDILLTYDWKEEQLTAQGKTDAIFGLLWTLYYYTGLSQKNTIVTNKKLNGYYFSNSLDLNFDYTLKNIAFRSDLHHCNLIGCKVENVSFHFKYISNLNFRQNTFYKSTLKGFFISPWVIGNTFKEVIFDDLILAGRMHFGENKLIRCKFISVRVMTKKWLTDFIIQNNVDSHFIKHHKIVTKRDKGPLKTPPRYYIEYFENPDE